MSMNVCSFTPSIFTVRTVLSAEAGGLILSFPILTLPLLDVGLTGVNIESNFNQDHVYKREERREQRLSVHCVRLSLSLFASISVQEGKIFPAVATEKKGPGNMFSRS